MYQDEFMQRAIALSREALTIPGVQPFGAVVVKAGAIVGEGLNRSNARHDPTSHGEVEAIREACRTLATLDLSDCELYSSCEPCPMCVATMSVASVGVLYYAASQSQAGAALAAVPASKRRRMNADLVRAEVGSPVEARRMPAEQHRADEAVAVLVDWASR